MRHKKSNLIMVVMMLAIIIGIGRIVYVDAIEAKDTKVVLLKDVNTAAKVQTVGDETESATSEPSAVASSTPTKSPEVIYTGEPLTSATPIATATVSQQADLGLSASYSVMNQKAVISVKTKSTEVQSISYVSGAVSSVTSTKWNTAKKVATSGKFDVTKKGTYSIRAVDAQGNAQITKVSVVMEIKAVWIYFDEMAKKAKSYSKWKNYIDSTFATCKKNKLNTVILQVRPFADAMYSSKYYPWSRYATGKAGRNPGFDPLKYAVTAAHEQGLSIQAWVNPYRISTSSSSISKLPKSSPAYKWGKSKSSSVRRRVLKLNGGLYFNPASSAVQTLVANGVRELVANYDIDGIHMDDYFYPSLGYANYRRFDYKEYKAYVRSCRKQKKGAMSLVNWRRENVNKMVRSVYATVKKVDKNCVFGISPAGNLTNLYSKTSYYSPVKTWMNSDKYIDYIVPQIYWSFTMKAAPYKKIVKQWTSIKRSDSVSLYIGLASYRAGISKREARAVSDVGWSKSNTILKRQVEYARTTKKVDGFYFFSYGAYTRNSAAKEVKNLLSVIDKR